MVVQLLSCVQLFGTPWAVEIQVSLSFTISQSWLKLMSIDAMSQWYHPTISSSITRFSSGPQSFPESEYSPISQCFASGGQIIGVSSSVLSMTIQDWFPLGWTGGISLQFKWLSTVFSNTTVRKYQFFHAQPSLLSNSHMIHGTMDWLDYW